jgi:hypothetical protein
VRVLDTGVGEGVIEIVVRSVTFSGAVLPSPGQVASTTSADLKTDVFDLVSSVPVAP